MDKSLGNNIKLIVEGGSHQDIISITIKNFPKGLKVNYDLINKNLNDRKAFDRIEEDNFKFISGLDNDITNGKDIIINVYNKNFDSSKYELGICRPNHVDYPAYIKYGNEYDYKGSGIFSGRMTVLYVIAGSLFEQLLLNDNIKVYTHIYKLNNKMDDKLSYNENDYNNLYNKKLKVLSNDFKNHIENTINNIDDDSIGAILETCILNIPIGIGSPLYNSIESVISHYMFSIGSIKGIEFGLGFDFVNYKGSEVLDTLKYENEKVKILNNYNGGINGGLSNGNPITFKVVVKPTNTILKEIDTINIVSKENIKYKNKGRHDKCIALRIAPVINAFTYIALYDLMKYEI